MWGFAIMKGNELELEVHKKPECFPHMVTNTLQNPTVDKTFQYT